MSNPKLFEVIAALREDRLPLAEQKLHAYLQAHPGDVEALSILAAVLTQRGETLGAIEAYQAVLRGHSGEPKIWTILGHLLKMAGSSKEAVEAYRRALALRPGLGEAWWGLADLKTFHFTPEDVAAMQARLAASTPEDGWHLHFALGKALEDRREYEASFGHYDKGNALCRRTKTYRADDATKYRESLQSVLTPDFFRLRADGGCPAPDPIFIVGLPRSGSTLVEQILASHSMVEGTAELPDIFALAGRLSPRDWRLFYPQVVPSLTPQQRTELGEEYLARTRSLRKLGRPYFIDKQPNNFLQIGFIALILPNAKIIDVRRHPMACCFSCFKQHFIRGQEFTYSQTDVGRYYADYVKLMAHYDDVLPGRIHRVQYEALVDDLEGTVHRLLDYCGLPFEESCLQFHANERVVRSASAEQVRRPVYRDAVEQWRHYEPWLGPLKEALGPA